MTLAFGYYDEWEVVTRKEQWGGPDFRANALGHSRYKCMHCKLGYFRVVSTLEHDEKCPECDYFVFVRRVVK